MQSVASSSGDEAPSGPQQRTLADAFEAAWSVPLSKRARRVATPQKTRVPSVQEKEALDTKKEALDKVKQLENENVKLRLDKRDLQKDKQELAAKLDAARKEVERLLQLATDERVASGASAGTSQPPDNLGTRERHQREKLARFMAIRRLAEMLGETHEQLGKAINHLLAILGFEVGDGRVISWRRVGRLERRPLTQFAGQKWLETPRLVIVEFRDVESKMAVKQESWRLAKGGRLSEVSLDHALTLEQQKMRAAQWPQIQEAKERGWRWGWSDVAPHRLVVLRGGKVDKGA
jgi:hypothetical protein